MCAFSLSVVVVVFVGVVVVAMVAIGVYNLWGQFYTIVVVFLWQ